jgi:hypothetical protein
MANKRQQKADYRTYSVRDAPDQPARQIGLRDGDFALLAKCAGGGWKVDKHDKANEKLCGELHRLGLVRFAFRNDGDWPYTVAVLTPTGAQALAQDPSIHARAIA